MNTPKLFLTDYASYNNGTQFVHGHWVDIDQFSDVEEFNDYVNEHFENAGIEDVEPMYTDFENFPKQWYSESSPEIEKIIKFANSNELKAIFEGDDSEIFSAWNEFCSEESRPDDEIYNFDEEFFTTFFEGRPMEAARAATFGNLNWSDDYIYFNGYGNLESTNDVTEIADIDELINWKIDQI